MKPRFGVVHGRFQVLHLDHLKYILAGAERCEHLVVGITNPDPSQIRFDPADPGRSSPDANPLTYFERYLMVKEALLEAGLSPRNFSVVPLPINVPELWPYYVPLEAVFFLTIYDEWGRRKLALLEKAGLKVEVLWEKSPSEKGLRATEIRELIRQGDERWRELVPPATVRILESLNLLSKIRGGE